MPIEVKRSLYYFNIKNIKTDDSWYISYTLINFLVVSASHSYFSEECIFKNMTVLFL